MDAIAPPLALPLHAMIRVAREASGLSLAQLEARALTDNAYISRLERGLQGNPSRDTLIRLGIGMGMGVEGINELLAAARYKLL
jgi:transcriptional regulator with XRE-family HTH domain